MTSYDYYQMQDDIMHYGIVGMKWGVRRFQNPDGTLTELGLKRASRENKLASKIAHYERKGNVRKENKYRNKFEKFAKKNKKIEEKIARYDAKQKAKRDEEWKTQKTAGDASKLSDQELAARKARLDLENSYKQAMSNARGDKPNAFTNWVKYNAGKVMGTAITTVAGAALTYKMKEIIGKKMNAAPNWETTHDKFMYMFPNKKK